jgi:hypothetical protein
VFKCKRYAVGIVVKRKVRLVAQGYIQKEGVDFEEVFAHVAHLNFVRLLVVVVAHQKWEVHHLGVKSAFLNGDMQEEVYVAQPPIFACDGN